MHGAGARQTGRNGRRADGRESMKPMPERRKRSKRTTNPLAAYRRIRKPMPPPERVIRDRRGELEQERARREIEER